MQLLQYNWHMFWLQDMMEHVVLSKSIKNAIENHVQKLILCFQKCKEYDINLNIDKCAFMVLSRIILGFIIFKERKILDPNKIQAIVNMPPPKNLHQIQVFNGMA